MIQPITKEKASYFPEPDKNIFYPVLDGEDGRCWRSHNGLIVIASAELHDGIEWLHVSFSRKSRIPDYKDVQFIKKHFFGEERKAVMIFPEKEHYVNLHPFCLHLFYSAENPLPEFSYNGTL